MEYLNKAKQILPTYKTIPLAQTLLNYVDELQTYFAAPDLDIQNLRKQVEAEKSYTAKIALQQQVITQYEELIGKGFTNYMPAWAGSLGSLAWYQLFAKQFPQAEKAAKREALNPTHYTTGWV